MRLLIALICGLGLNSVFAAEKAEHVCTKFLQCGVYEGAGVDWDGSKENPTGYRDKTTVIANGEMSAIIEIEVSRGSRHVFYMSAELDFAEDGTFTAKLSFPKSKNDATNKGKRVAVGLCRRMTCTFSYMSRNDQATPVGNISVLHFKEDKLVRRTLTSHAEFDYFHSHKISELTKN